MDLASLGRSIRREREAQGLTLRALGERAGVSYAYIGAIENATNNGNVTVAALESIATGLGTDLTVGIGADPIAALRPALDGLPAHRRDLVFQAAAALASLPEHELQLEATMLQMRAARVVREPAAEPYVTPKRNPA